MKVISKAKQVLNSVPKRLAAIFGVVAAVMVPLAIYAWGPSRETFTIEKPATYVTFDSITNNPNYGDERNFLRVRDSDKQYWSDSSTNGWTDTMTMQEGHTYDVRLYVHNNAASNLNLKSTNTRAFINLPIKDNTYGKQFELNGYIMSDNAKPNKIWDNIVLKSDKAFHVKVVSQKYINNIKTEADGGFNIGNEVYSGDGTGALIGYEKMDGVVPGCFQYSGYVLLKIQPVFQVVPAPAYDVEKTVDKTTAKPGETINYTINVKNTGNVNLTNVKVTDKLPAYYSEAKETVTSKNGSTGSIVKGGEITLAKLNVGETATIKISYTIKGAEQLECGETIIKNKATGTTDQDQTEDNNNNNEVTTTVTNDCPEPKEPGYDISKAVDKTAAKPGETINYTITVRNTGEVDLTNVKVNDKLPAYYSNATEKVEAPSEIAGSIVKDGRVTIAKLPVGQSATITVTYQIKSGNDLECGETVIKNKVTGTTDQDQTEDNNDNNEVVTTVTNDCGYSYDLIKSVDKTTANLGDTLTYTLTFKNTGRQDVTNVVIKDTLPAGVTMVGDIQTNPQTEVSGDLTKDGIKIAKVAAGKQVEITFTAKITATENELQCGDNKFTNTASSTTNEDQTEDNNDNNTVTTVVTRVCEPETPPVVPPETPEQPQNPVPETPTVIAQTGAGETVASIIGLGVLAAAITAYIRSRKLAAEQK